MRAISREVVVYFIEEKFVHQRKKGEDVMWDFDHIMLYFSIAALVLAVGLLLYRPWPREKRYDRRMHDGDTE